MKTITISDELGLHLIEHLQGEMQWWESNVVGGDACPDCCKDEGPDHECLYREAKRVLGQLTESIQAAEGG